MADKKDYMFRHTLLETPAFKIILMENLNTANLMQIGPGGEILADIPIPNDHLLEVARNFNEAAKEIDKKLNHSNSKKCGNCGVYRMVNYPMVEKCPNCGDDEYDITEKAVI